MALSRQQFEVSTVQVLAILQLTNLRKLDSPQARFETNHPARTKADFKEKVI